jgi:diadenosine tetraphosphate (Ap4A) HIT family hydrolase
MISDPVVENALAFAVYDTWPVTEGHLLIIPKRHYPSVFEASREELEAMAELVKLGKSILDEKYKPDGYNIGVNIGTASGQTIMHVHLHLIPRFVGDVSEPLGGVRGVIPARQKYPSP